MDGKRPKGKMSKGKNIENKNVENKNMRWGWTCKIEVEDDRDFYFNILSFSAFLFIYIWIIFVFDIFIFEIYPFRHFSFRPFPIIPNILLTIKYHSSNMSLDASAFIQLLMYPILTVAFLHSTKVSTTYLHSFIVCHIDKSYCSSI
jgi:hypothetical protein